MGLKIWMLVYADGDPAAALAREPPLQRAETIEFVQLLFPGRKLAEAGDTGLHDAAPKRRRIHAGPYEGVAVAAGRWFALDHPSRLSPHFLQAFPSRNVYLVAAHSTVDWFAFAHWSDGRLVRSLSLSPDDGIREDLGPRLPFEQPFWDGYRPVPAGADGPYPLAFHPLELADAAAMALFGYAIEGSPAGDRFRPEAIRLLKLKPPAWWRPWA